jgi:hypothetical protein
MIFACDNIRYDTTGMLQWETPDPQVPLIFALQDLSRIFVVTFDQDRGIEVHRAADDEVLDLSQRHAIPGLLRALTHRQDPRQ